LRAETWG